MNSKVCAISSTGFHSRILVAFSQFKRSNVASLVDAFFAISQELTPQHSPRAATNSETFISCSVGGPKLKDSPCKSLRLCKTCANRIYPLRGSNTCCHGRVAEGFRMVTPLFIAHRFTQSGTMRFSPQSPPPITFPALADDLDATIIVKETPNM